jgi:hypothetical protein
MTSRYLEQLATISANDTVSMWLFIGAGLIIAALFFSRAIAFPRLRHAVKLTTLAVCLCTYFALLISPLLGAL